MVITLYGTGCPRCNVLKKKLEAIGVEYAECSDVQKMMDMGITVVPVLYVDGNLLSFAEANAWVNNYGGGSEICK